MREAGPRWRGRSGLEPAASAFALVLSLMLAACSKGAAVLEPGADPTPDCRGQCADPGVALSVADVERILAQGIAEAQAQGRAATLAVTDRVGNVLAVYRMTGAPETVRVGSPEPLSGGLEGVSLVPATLSAIAKALTGAYLSSEGNAFSTRTASQIVQAHFNPGEFDQPGGPLFGVQFSQLPCSDLSARAQAAGVSPGPHRSPLGLAADPGGFPLYKNGTVVGGVGVEADGAYTLDPSVFDLDQDLDEIVALAASFGFGAPPDRRGDRITVEGKTLRFSDARLANLRSNPAMAPAFGSLGPGVGQLVAVTGYAPALIRAGTAFGQPASGIRPSSDPDFAALDLFELVDAADQPRFPPLGDPAAGGLTAAEVREVLRQAAGVARAARAQIRRPLGSPAAVSIAVVGQDGQVLGLVRTRDAPVFGTDVALQKARAALLFSRPLGEVRTLLAGLPPAGYLAPDSPTPMQAGLSAPAGYLDALLALLGQGPTPPGIAFANRSIGNFARPFFPDGVTGTPHGPLSKPAGEWSPFNTGLQLDLGYNAVVRHVAFVAGIPGVPDVPQACAGVSPLDEGLADSPVPPVARNGIQIFPGSVPIYRGNDLVGAIGISGDGIEQDDMIAFLGVHRAGQALGGAIGNAPPALRADRLLIQGQRPRYVQCPQAPFIGRTEERVCEGL